MEWIACDEKQQFIFDDFSLILTNHSLFPPNEEVSFSLRELLNNNDVSYKSGTLSAKREKFIFCSPSFYKQQADKFVVFIFLKLIILILSETSMKRERVNF